MSECKEKPVEEYVIERMVLKAQLDRAADLHNAMAQKYVKEKERLDRVKNWAEHIVAGIPEDEIEFDAGLRFAAEKVLELLKEQAS
jgi:hypothetical protein